MSEIEKENEEENKSLCWIFLADFLSGSFNWVRHKVYPPAWERRGWESESLRVFNTRQESGNGTRVLGTGSLSVPQIWDRNPRLGPALLAIGSPFIVIY